ncbi:hypothetical protein CDD82_4922 [Ophiocordyceps australis]|uniref:ABC transporter domain-containing protein n=1 Tax=Ophiocordyceps australis TaxID=1399860 RepID=A0A2C5ZNV6_9HYPO|nr:hypothetical protein CDD82_4922 [Ophiocordyceps australis]
MDSMYNGASAGAQEALKNEKMHAADNFKNEKKDASAEWELKPRVVDFRQRDQASGNPPRELGVTWENLTVEALSADAAIHENVASQFNIPKLIQESRQKPPLKKILDNSHGCVKPGEMLLVLGRPGSGCTTLLNMLANKRKGYSNVTGQVHYGSMKASEMKQYSGQVVMNTEEEVFFPTLTVGQTMDFATRLKVPYTLPQGVADAETHRRESLKFLLQSMNIQHTSDTKVGNAFVRGVSGGERKRVSIIECLATRGSIFCWDNSTRGLDASSALDYAKAIRAMTDVLGLASIVTLYQAGNGIYNLFDKVLVLDQGREIYYGPMKQARPFMEDLGFICAPGANVADFLTGITVPTERRVRGSARHTFPKNGGAIREEYQNSHIYRDMVAEYDYPTSSQAEGRTSLFRQSVAKEKSNRLPKSSPLTVSFPAQIKACVLRQYQIIWGDKATFFIKQASTIVQSLVAGSLFYNAPSTTAGLFSKSGACFFSLLFNTLMAMSEVTDSFTGRPVLIKHKSFAYFHPAAFCFAQIAADIPVILFQVSIFSVILYFMVGLTTSASAFFTYWVIVVAATMCMTALFRAIGAAFSTFDDASKVSGLIISASFMYMGYMIQKPHMHPWFVWLFWIDPLAYAFDALLSNEFHGKVIPCVNNNLIPNGPGFGGPGQQASCAGVGGAISRQTVIQGDRYLASLSYNHAHVWRNFGIVWAWWALFVAITVFSTTRWKPASENGPSLLIPRENSRVVAASRRADVEEADSAGKREMPVHDPSATEVEMSSDEGMAVVPNLVRNTSIFTWKNLCYTVKTPTGDRLLLDNVQGWVKPGMLTALMGSSGAGKTTLLDVLAQRKTDGTIRGSIMVDGRPLPVSFQRSAGYCEQLDVHESYATVREALEFSALLRQSRDTPRAEKLAYVGAGLSVEQRKRVTIGVELVSKPSILIFLDEPTSGLDGQSAYHTVRFLRKLAAVGQAVLVTIHQPSAQLFAQFDTLLLLAKGGKTVYFGDIGDEALTIRNYFGRYGAPCPAEANPAEHMIDVVSGTLSQGKNWSDVWLASPEYAAMTQELDDMIADAAAKPPGTVDDGHEFATSLWEQMKLVTHRNNVSLYRNVGYLNNKFALHIFSALFNGFSFWMIGDSVGDLQLKLFTIFNFIFRRDIFETREKKSKMYSWVAFVTGLIVSEIPYLLICGVLYFVCWYYTVGLPHSSNRSGATLFVMLMYEFIYTGIGQFVAAYAPNDVFAALVNPIQAFWRYWIYYLNPFNYLMGSMLVFGLWGSDVRCSERELAVFDPPNGSTCAHHLVNPAATASCRVCTYTRGEDYLRTLNLKDYALVYVLMKLRTKTSKKAE